jgi:hypothetical protein
MPIHDWTRVRSGRFHNFHVNWISSLCRALNAGCLPSGYFAMAEQVAKGVIPDVLALEESSSEVRSEGRGRPTDSGGTAVASPTPKTRIVREFEEDLYARKANRIAIRLDDDRIVAVIEIVSPGNKSSKSALRSFVGKAVELIDLGIHLLVVDLFPPSKRDPAGLHKAIWDEFHEEEFELPSDKPLTLASYCAGLRRKAFVELVAVGDCLPDMPLFLTPEFWIPTPLEATYQTTWNELPGALKRPFET